MTRNESQIFSIKPEKPEKIIGDELETVRKLFDSKKIFVFCEGRIEYHYFSGLKKSFNNSRINIIPRFPSSTLNEGTDIKKLVEQIIESKQNEKVKVESNNKLLTFDIHSNDEFNIIFDADANFNKNKYDKSKYDEAMELFEKGEIKLYLSNYSFGIWILCHFEKPPTVLMKNKQPKIKDILPKRIKNKYVPKYHDNYQLIYPELESKFQHLLLLTQ